MDLQLPHDVYLRVSAQIQAIVSKLDSLSEDAEVSGAKEQALGTFTQISDEIAEHITALQKNAEWETFTIAFYGETNAGKSTLIETLRILLNEPSKVATRTAFTALREQHGLSDEQFAAVRTMIARADEQVAGLQSALADAEEQSAIEAATFLQQVAALDQAIAEKIHRSLWQRLLHRFGRLPELRQRGVLRQELRAVERLRAERSDALREQMATAARARSEQAGRLRQMEDALPALGELADGTIIGTGRPDFTVQTQAYRFGATADPFMLLDVPGIEGSESKVSEQISAAVQKAHAVFYVTGKPSAPQQGSARQDGTLQKIKRHLNAQTEVRTIYNKRITNPMPLKQTALVSEGERDSLLDLDAKMSEELGKHYFGTISVSALPAFLAVAECLPPGSTHAAGRAKFLASLDRETILQKSNFSGLHDLLLQDLVKNHKQKIQRSNFNKAHGVVLAASRSVDAVLKGSFRPLAIQLRRDATQAGKQIDAEFDALKSRVESQAESAISAFINAVRNTVYTRIDVGISNDAFESAFKRSVKSEQDKLVAQLSEGTRHEVDTFQKQISKIVGRHQERAAELATAYGSIDVDGVGARIDLKIEIDNGIQVVGLIGALVGGALLIWSPAGWAMIALGIVGVVVGVWKAAAGFFSPDYKKSQQRQAVGENLSNISSSMRASIRENLDSALPKLEPKVAELKQILTKPGEQVGNVVELLAEAGTQLKNISREIKPGRAP